MEGWARHIRRVVTTVTAAAAIAAAAPAAGEATVLAKGSRGDGVAKLNAKLAKLTYLPAGADSSRFTLGTHHAVVAFQKVNGLAPDGVVGPVTRSALRDASAPRPRVERDGRRVEVWRGRQVAVLVADGRVRRTVHVSTGRAGYRTPAGTFRVYRRERLSWSYVYDVWLPWAVYFNGGIAFHAHRRVPPYPVSHGCVRVPRPFAREVYDFARPRRVVSVL